MAPRLSSRPASKPKPTTIDKTHNQTSEAEKKRAARAIALRRIMNDYRQADAACNESKAAHKENTDSKTQVARLAKAELGITRKALDQYLADMNASKRDLIAEEQIRRQDRESLGILNAEQLDMFSSDKAPPTAKDEVYWRAEGYQAGMRLDAASPPKECPPRHVQDWLNGHGDGMKVMNDAIGAPDEADPMGDEPDAPNDRQSIVLADLDPDSPEGKELISQIEASEAGEESKALDHLMEDETIAPVGEAI